MNLPRSSRTIVRVLASLALLLGLVPSRVPVLGEEHPRGIDVSVMSFNIRYGTAQDGENHWEKRRGLVLDVLRRHDPDVVGLQEALRHQIDEILAALAAYAELGVGRDDGKEKGEYTVVLYKPSRLDAGESGTFWFSDTPESPGSASWGNRYPRICTWARFIERSTCTAFYLYNVHLDHESQPSREKSADLLARRIARRRHPDAYIVTGDFNAGEENKAVLSLKAGCQGPEPALPGMVDTYRVRHPGEKAVRTFHGFRGGVDGEKIDYILAPSWVETIDAVIIRDSQDGRFPSDHYPVAARIHVPRAQES